MKLENDIEVLFRKVDKVEVSPFLITRIKQKISNAQSNKLSIQVIKRLAFVGSLTLILNLASIYFKQNNHSNKALLLDALNLNSENNLILRYE